MNNQETPVTGTIFVTVHDGDVVVKGRDGTGPARVVGRANVTTQNGNTVITARESIVIEAPSSSPIEISGSTYDVALKNVGTVRLNEIQGSISVNGAEAVTASDIHGNASLRDVKQSVTFNDVHGNFSVKQVGSLHISGIHGNADCKAVDEVQFQDVHGELSVKEARTVSGDTIQGHGTFKQVEQITLNTVSGELTVKGGKDVRVETVEGDVVLKGVEGTAAFDSVSGNLEIKGIPMSITAAEVEGDVNIRGTWQAGGEYTIGAQGTVSLRTDGNAHLIISNENGILRGEGMEVETDNDGRHHVYIGSRDNAATVTIEAEGDVFVNARDDDEGNYDHWGHRWGRHEHRHHHGDQEWDWERHGPEVEAEVRRAMEEARAEFQRAGDQVRRELERARQEIERNARGPVGHVVRNAMNDLMSSLRDPSSVRVEKPVAEKPVTDSSDEVRTVLQMLAEGKITADQAEQLLQAMGEK